MYISKFRIKNYKSYLDSNEVDLEPGINIITGQNNAGKTALLQVLSHSFIDIPHRSSNNLRSKLEQNIETPELEITLNVAQEDFNHYLYTNQNLLKLPKITHLPIGKTELEHFKRIVNNLKYCKISYSYAGREKIKFCKLNENEVLEQLTYVYELSKNNVEYKRNIGFQPSNNSFITPIQSLINNIYYFHAERLNISKCAQGTNTKLNPNANNLPEVLNILQSNKIKFLRYIEGIKIIFPQIHDISIKPIPNNSVEIVIWNEDPKNERDDLVVPLSECGTGLGQVMAILYVVLTSDVPHVIIIDEPNSFLHPGACRKLIEILKEHPQHQFIIATHSPSTIAAANPKTINIVKKKEAQSSIEMVDIRELKEQQSYLTEIGSRLSDVFGSDNILWVEGKTEELCFPKIIDKTDGLSMMGTSILSVKNTGDFESTNKRLIFDIYKKLSQGGGLMPPAIGFIFDRENKKEKEIKDLERESKNSVKFIDRRMYENYLLDSNAIFSVIENYDIEDLEIKLLDIEKWIEKNKWKKEYFNGKEKTEELWIIQVNAAKFLTDMFKTLSKNKIEYNKTKHSVMLTEWLLENRPEAFEEINTLLKSILNKKIS